MNLTDSRYTFEAFAKLINVSSRTLYRWVSSGKITPYRLPSGKPFFTDDHLKFTPPVSKEDPHE